MPITLPGEGEQPAFVEVLVSGELSLFKHQEYFFVSDDGVLLTPLEDKGQAKVINGKMVWHGGGNYKGVLNHYLAGCPSVQKRTKNLRINEKALTSLITLYNECVGAAYEEYKKTKPWLSVSPAFAAGLVASQVSFRAVDLIYYSTYHLTESDFKVSVSPAAGLLLDFSSPRISERASIQTGIFYYRSVYEGVYIKEYVHMTERHDVNIKMDELNIPLGVRYTFPASTSTPYLSFGLSASVNLEPQSLHRRDRTYLSYNETTEREALAIKKHQTGIWGAAGMSKKLSDQWEGFLEMRYTYSSGITGETFNPNVQSGLTSRLNYLKLVLGVRL